MATLAGVQASPTQLMNLRRALQAPSTTQVDFQGALFVLISRMRGFALFLVLCDLSIRDNPHHPYKSQESLTQILK